MAQNVPMDGTIYKRNIFNRVKQSLKKTPVLLITGARQIGKTTLVQEIGDKLGYSYTSFDDLFIQTEANENPIGFIENLLKPAILDEVQSAPTIFLPIKLDVDTHLKKKGRYLLTGSANPLIVPKLGDSLAGRMQLIHMWPFSQGELRETVENFVDTIFSKSKLVPTSITKKELAKMVVRGGYPAMQNFRNDKDRYQWCNSYLTTLTQKDITDLAKIENLRSIPNILKTLALRTGHLLNERDVARTMDIPITTIHRYLQLLQHLFLVYFLPGWYRNQEKRLVKASKVYFVDTAILLHLLGYNEERLLQTPEMFGHVIENFVLTEILKQLSWNETIVNGYHFRSHDGLEEVDLVLESTSGKTIGIEIKASETITAHDFKGLKKLESIIGKEFYKGIVLYIGSKSLTFADNLIALPISALWQNH